jgi:MFS transporter, YNFM family, putative membrane transport protein
LLKLRLRAMPGEPMSGASIVRPIVVLSAAAFASVAAMRVADPLIPQIAQELDVSFGDASVITTAFAISYVLCQLVWGALGDRFGKYRLVALMTLLSGLTVALAGFAGTLAALGAARLAAGATAAAIVPLAFAFIGDHVPYERRQTVLARFLTGTILGIIAGQTAGGVLGDLFGWRGVFFLLGGLFLLVGSLLVVELRSGRVPPPILSDAIGPVALMEAYLILLRRPWARVILVTVAIEGFLFYGGFTFVAAYLHDRFDLDYAIVGIVLGCFGVGGLLYALTVRRLLRALGERGLALVGGTIIAFAFFVVALGGLLVMAPAILLLGLGITMLHNTLQTHATQMAPGARGLAVSTFANVLFLGQAAGVWLCGRLIDDIGFAPVFIVLGIALAVLGAVFAQMLGRRPATA